MPLTRQDAFPGRRAGDDKDQYGKPRAFWDKVLDDTGRAHLVANIVGSMTKPATGMDDAAKRIGIQQRMLAHRYKVHPDFGAAVERGIGGTTMKVAAE